MASLDTISISYRGKEYSAAIIPNVFTSDNQTILIGSHSLNVAIHDDDKGYVDDIEFIKEIKLADDKYLDELWKNVKV